MTSFFQFHQIDGTLDHSSQIYAFSINGYVRKVAENRRGIFWQLTEEGIKRVAGSETGNGTGSGKETGIGTETGNGTGTEDGTGIGNGTGTGTGGVSR